MTTLHHFQSPPHDWVLRQLDTGDIYLIQDPASVESSPQIPITETIVNEGNLVLHPRSQLQPYQYLNTPLVFLSSKGLTRFIPLEDREPRITTYLFKEDLSSVPSYPIPLQLDRNHPYTPEEVRTLSQNIRMLTLDIKFSCLQDMVPITNILSTNAQQAMQLLNSTGDGSIQVIEFLLSNLEHPDSQLAENHLIRQQLIQQLMYKVKKYDKLMTSLDSLCQLKLKLEVITHDIQSQVSSLLQVSQDLDQIE